MPYWILVILFALPAMMPATGWGCVGARPLGMGGAYVAVADDANATYWNPAALAFQESPRLTGMYITGEDINYKAFASYVQPVGRHFALAASVYTLNNHSIHTDFRRPWVSIAVQWPRFPYGDFALGANISFGQDKYLDHDPGLDLSLVYRISEQWSIGLLVQDVNEASIKSDGVEITHWARNIRPGISYRPIHGLTIAADIYRFGEEDERVMVGTEYWLDDRHGIRYGLYGMDGEDKKFHTLGASYRHGSVFRLDLTIFDYRWGVISVTLGF